MSDTLLTIYFFFYGLFSTSVNVYLLTKMQKVKRIPQPKSTFNYQLKSLTESLISSDELQKDRENIFEEILNLSTHGYWVWELPSGYDYLSENWCAILGYKQDELKPHVDTWTSLMHPEDRPKAEAAMREHIKHKGTKPYKLTARYKHKLGYWVVLKDVGKVIKWDGDTPIRMVGFETFVRTEKK